MEKRLEQLRKDQGDLDRSQEWFITSAKMTKRFDIIRYEHRHSAKIVLGSTARGTLHAIMQPIQFVSPKAVLFIELRDGKPSFAVEGHILDAEIVKVLPRWMAPVLPVTIRLPPRVQSSFNRVAKRIIIKENCGDMGLSGFYYPKTERSAKRLYSLFNMAAKVRARQMRSQKAAITSSLSCRRVT